MATSVADRAVLDTNILLAATDESREDHEDAIAAINVWPASGVVLPTMLVHGIDTVVTLNVDDFARFGHQVRVVGLRG